MSEELASLEALVHNELMDLDALNTRMRENGLPIVSTSVDATPGATVSTYRELQTIEANTVALMNLTPEQIHYRIQAYKFEVWTKTVQMMECVRILENIKNTMTANEISHRKLNSGVAFNPKSLVTPTQLSKAGKAKVPQTAEEKRMKEMKKLLPHMSEAEILEQFRQARSEAFQKGIEKSGGAGSPVSVNICPDCAAEYSGQHKCPKAAPKTDDNPDKPKPTLNERIAAMRAARAAANQPKETEELFCGPIRPAVVWGMQINTIFYRVISLIGSGKDEQAYRSTIELVQASKELGNTY